MPAALHERIRILDLLKLEPPIDYRMNFIYFKCPVKLILHFTAAHVNAVYCKAFSHDGQLIDLPLKSGQHAHFPRRRLARRQVLNVKRVDSFLTGLY